MICILTNKGCVLNKSWIGIVLAMVLGLTLVGCETMRESWEDTQEFYKKYVNVDPEVTLDPGDVDPGRYKLAKLFAPLDLRIEEASRELGGLDYFPDDKWIDAYFAEFSWVSGVIVTGLDGQVLLQQPETAMKPISAEPFLEDPEALKDRRLRAEFQDTELGPEVYLASSFFKDSELQGVVAIHFDIRNLTDFSPNPEELVVFTPELLLWAGDAVDAAPLLDNPWSEILANDVAGEIEAGGKEFVWVSRFIGDKKVLYAVGKPAEE